MVKMRALTAQVYVDDIEDEDGLTDCVLDSEVMATVPRPGTSLRLPMTGGYKSVHSEYLKLQTSQCG